MRYVLTSCLLALGACTSQSSDTSAESTEAFETSEPWRFDTEAAALREASCPEGQAFERALAMDITETEIDLGPETAQNAQLQGMTFAGA
ncbi:MAG: hypothetical protein AAGJ85_07330 [Pseudomonadota bacterium]